MTRIGMIACFVIIEELDEVHTDTRPSTIRDQRCF
jgi:hypothetical protein